MAKRTPYEDLHLLPWVVADTVATTKYDGSELSLRLRSSDDVEKTEAKRQAMTPEQVKEFATLVDARCKAAYEANVDYFMKCLKGNKGRDQLYMWVKHWLASYLNDPEMLRRTV